MERMTDDELKELNNLNINSNFQNQKQIKENIIKHNFTKMKNLLNQIINSDVKLDKLEDNLANNLSIPSYFKNKRPNKENNISSNISLGKDTKLLENKNQESKKNSLSNNSNYNLNNNHKNPQDNISSNINIQNSNILDKNLFNISSQINLGDQMLRKKRKPVEIKEKNENKIIYEEIKKIYNDFIKNNKMKEKTKNNIIIYTHKGGYYEIQETIIIKNNPVCIIYLYHENITKIFSIKEQNNYKNEKEIKLFLEKVKSDLESLCRNE